MITIEELADEAVFRGEVLNTMFEERLLGLVDSLLRVAGPLNENNVPYELIGGLAVLLHVEEVDPEQAMLTRDVDLMVYRNDLDRIKELVSDFGFRFRHARGVDMLLFGDTDSAKNAIHLVFSGEMVRDTQVIANPEIAPHVKTVYGHEVNVIALPDLVRMKLSSYRLKDQVHVQVMDAAGLITPEVEEYLPEDLRIRLANVRAQD